MEERRSDRAHPRKLHLMFILPCFIGAHSRTSEKSGRLSRIDCDNPWLTRLRMALSSTVDSNLPRAVGRARNGALIVQARRSVNTLSLCLIILLILTIVNLRGMREAGLLFMVLTCIFVGTLLAMIAIGIWAAIAAAPGRRSPGGNPRGSKRRALAITFHNCWRRWRARGLSITSVSSRSCWFFACRRIPRSRIFPASGR